MFVAALHISGFVVERNSEWHIASKEREYLVRELLEDRELFSQCNHFLIEVAQEGSANRRDSEIPAYLLGAVGSAYHKTAVSPAEGLPLYAEAFTGSLGQQWLAARLITEQERLGVLPSGAIEPAFLRGMVLYREGRRAEAIQALRPVANSKEQRQEVAVACHLVGRSLWARSPTEAEGMLRRSLDILEEIRDRHGQAQVLHTLGQNLWRRDPTEAEGMLRRSLEIGEAIGHRFHQAQVLHTLGQNLWWRDPTEAEGMLRRSLDILEKIRDRHGQAQVLHTLGQKLWRRDATEAEGMLRRSLDILEKIGDHRGQAMLLLSLGRFLWETDKDEGAGKDLMLRSLQLNRDARDRSGENIVLRQLRDYGIDYSGI